MILDKHLSHHLQNLHLLISLPRRYKKSSSSQLQGKIHHWGKTKRGETTAAGIRRLISEQYLPRRDLLPIVGYPTSREIDVCYREGHANATMTDAKGFPVAMSTTDERQIPTRGRSVLPEKYTLQRR